MNLPVICPRAFSVSRNKHHFVSHSYAHNIKRNFHTPAMSVPPNSSPLDHRVVVVSVLLAYYVYRSRNVADGTEGEVQAILTETLREAREDIHQAPASELPMSEYLSILLHCFWACAQARSTLLRKLVFLWLCLPVALPVFLLFRYTLVWNTAGWTVKLVIRKYRCQRAHDEQMDRLRDTMRNTAQDELRNLTDDEARWMVYKIIFLSWVAGWLRVFDT